MNKVEKGMKVLSELLCKNAVLHLRGLNGAILTKIFAQPEESLVLGAQVGDISEDDLRQVIAEIEVTQDLQLFKKYLVFTQFRCDLMQKQGRKCWSTS